MWINPVLPPLFLINFIGVQAADTSVPATCSSSSPHYIPDPVDCQGYYQCAAGHAPARHTCGGALRWSTTINNCDHAYNVPCPRTLQALGRSSWICDDCYKAQVPLFQLFMDPLKPFDKSSVINAICEEEDNKDDCKEILPKWWSNQEPTFWSGLWSHLCNSIDCQVKSSSEPLRCDSCVEKISRHFDYITYSQPAQLSPACQVVYGNTTDTQKCLRLVQSLLSNIMNKFIETEKNWINIFCQEKMGCGGYPIEPTSRPTIAPGSPISNNMTCEHCTRGSSALMLQLLHYSQVESQTDVLVENICEPLGKESCTTYLQKFWPEWGKLVWFGLIPHKMCDDLSCSSDQGPVPDGMLISCGGCSNRINNLLDQLKPPYEFTYLKGHCDHSNIFENKTDCKDGIDKFGPSVFNTFLNMDRKWIDTFCREKMDCSSN